MPVAGGPPAPIIREPSELRRPSSRSVIDWLRAMIRRRRAEIHTTIWNLGDWMAQIGRDADWGGEFGDPRGLPARRGRR